MKYTITMKRESKQTCHVLVNGLYVAVGPEKMCEALVRELRTSKEKAELVYNLEKIEPFNTEDPEHVRVYG